MLNLKPGEYRKVDGYVITDKFLGKVLYRLVKGQYGAVYRGYLESEPQKIVAAKIMPAQEVQHISKLVNRELNIIAKVDSPHIVRFLHKARTKNSLYIFLEYCNGGDLQNLIKQKQYLSEAESLNYFREIVSGFKSIYQENIIHRDIKPANILMHFGQAKIADFGFARIVDDMEDKEDLTILGSPVYMSPQILAQHKYSSKCDIWSLGIVFYEMLYGAIPWQGINQSDLLGNIKKLPLKFSAATSQPIIELISSMLKFTEEERISWPELFEHSLVKEAPATLQQDIAMIQESPTLEQSIMFNSQYVNQNKVLREGGSQATLQINKLPSQDNELEMEIESPFQKRPELEFNPGMTIDEITNVQTNILFQDEQNSRIDVALMKTRNIGVFVNVATNMIYQTCKQNKIKFEEHLFYRIIFILSKYQMIIFQELTNIMASKQPIGQGFNEADWKNYKQSSKYFTTLNAIKGDKARFKPYFNTVFSITAKYLEKVKQTQNAQEQQEIQIFQQILNASLASDQHFQEVYTSTIRQFMKQAQLIEDHDSLQGLKYLFVCLDPFGYFQNQGYDFHKFYELYTKMPTDKLLEEVQRDFKTL